MGIKMDFETRCREWEGGYRDGIKTAMCLIRASMGEFEDARTHELLMRLYADVGAYLER